MLPSVYAHTLTLPCWTCFAGTAGRCWVQAQARPCTLRPPPGTPPSKAPSCPPVWTMPLARGGEGGSRKDTNRPGGTREKENKITQEIKTGSLLEQSTAQGIPLWVPTHSLRGTTRGTSTGGPQIQAQHEHHSRREFQRIQSYQDSSCSDQPTPGSPSGTTCRHGVEPRPTTWWQVPSVSIATLGAPGHS